MTRLCGCRGIDIHCHIVPSDFPPYLKGPAPSGWPSMVAEGSCHKTIVIDGRNYRTVSDACWDASRRLSDMDRMGIKTQALSPMPELFSYWMDTGPANDFVRYLNDIIAEMTVTSPGRFVGLGTVALQDVDTAIEELHRLMCELKFSGVEIGSNINGVPIGDPRFLPFFAEAEALGAAVFVHAVRPAGMDRLVGPGQLQQVLAYPTDVGLAAASVITSNLTLKHPLLRLAFSHGGGTLASLLPRLDEGWRVFPALRDAILEQPSAQARRLYFDTLVYDAPTLRHLTSLFGDERILLGTDYPFNFHEKAPLDRIAAAFDGDLVKDRLAFLNAAGFLALEVQS